MLNGPYMESWKGDALFFYYLTFDESLQLYLFKKRKKKIRRAKSRCLPYGDRSSSLGCIYKTLKTIACSAISIYCKLHLTVTIRSTSRRNPERRPKEEEKKNKSHKCYSNSASRHREVFSPSVDTKGTSS